ncbi:MAG: phytanoyl-CoA dioxygenase, partial [Armatimonadetes bacterium]|nr:phytanoyl-CoA dioxygenase [Armatimonadota bacterium]
PEQFQAEGYLVLPSVFETDEIARMRSEADRILELILNSSVALERCSSRLDWRELPGGTQIVRKIQPINDLSDYLTEVSHDPRLLQPMRQIMGHEPILMEEKLNYKQPLPERVGGIAVRPLDDRFPVHNDWAYYRVQNYPQDILSSAISLDDCPPESGPIRVWPGSHVRHLEHEAVDIGLQVERGLIDFEGGVDILAPAGSVMLFHALLVHNSRSNTSGKPRRIMIYSHYPDRVDMGHDVRNGPTRAQEQPFEARYRELVERSEFVPVFQAPA